jgi:hypothetical protein
VNKPVSIAMSMVLIFVGVLTLVCSLVGPILGFRIWQLWPLTVVFAGLLLVLPPLLVRGKRGLGGLFIPGVPILTTGAILLFASVLRHWNVWAWLWPLEVLGLAVGFLFAAIYMRVIWLLIPAIIVGLNGLLLQFCALTGLWRVWAVLWTIEPLSVGLALLVVNIKQRSRGLLVAGITMCALAGVGLVESLAIVLLSALFPAWWLWRWTGPVTLILAGSALLVWSLVRHSPAPKPSTST